MGRIKTQLIKRISNKLFTEHRNELKKDFKENKEAVAKLAVIPSKKIRNVIAGYVTRLMQIKED
ncbi:30S ribosomal protein S17e [Candidatus Woesearchaeota archaeon]|nr:30S ribosomal protein S17e [Candidatus Woesearchaeota archaeon]